jgi:hypothetical protein
MLRTLLLRKETEQQAVLVELLVLDGDGFTPTKDNRFSTEWFRIEPLMQVLMVISV